MGGRPTGPSASLALARFDFQLSSVVAMNSQGINSVNPSPIANHTLPRVERLGRKAGFEFKLHPHMLRHSTGYKLANDRKDMRSIQDYLGHVNIQHTVKYTALAPTRFKDFWR
jgi:site-specific recombinase XerD